MEVLAIEMNSLKKFKRSLAAVRSFMRDVTLPVRQDGLSKFIKDVMKLNAEHNIKIAKEEKRKNEFVTGGVIPKRITDMKFHIGGSVPGTDTKLLLHHGLKFNVLDGEKIIPSDEIINELKYEKQRLENESYTCGVDDFINRHKYILPRWWETLEADKILKGRTYRKAMENDKNESGSKYLKRIVLAAPPVITEDLYYDGLVDVYAVTDAYNVTCPARAHAIKKLLCSGQRGGKDALQDIKEAKDAIIRAYDMEKARIRMATGYKS